MKKIRVSRQLMVAILLSVMTVPFATMQTMSAAANSLPKGVISDEMRERVQEYERDVRERRQAYAKAVLDCQDEIIKTKIKIKCPVYNEISTYQEYLPKNSKYRMSKAALEAGTGASVVDMAEKQAEVERKERMLLRRYIQVGYCPLSLKKFSLNGFFELCQRMVKNNITDTRGLVNEKAALHPEATYKPITLKERLEMVRQARDPSTRRANTKVGTTSESSSVSSEHAAE